MGKQERDKERIRRKEALKLGKQKKSLTFKKRKDLLQTPQNQIKNYQQNQDENKFRIQHKHSWRIIAGLIFQGYKQKTELNKSFLKNQISFTKLICTNTKPWKNQHLGQEWLRIFNSFKQKYKKKSQQLKIQENFSEKLRAIRDHQKYKFKEVDLYRFFGAMQKKCEDTSQSSSNPSLWNLDQEDCLEDSELI